MRPSEPCPLGSLVQLACEWEVIARKAGNVHRDRDFTGLRCADFLASAAAIAPVFDRAASQSVGRTVLDAITATQAVAATNTNLGIVLLLAPLAAVPAGPSWRARLPFVLGSLDVADARLVFQAIRLARPGGLGKAAAEDVAGEPTLPLHNIMALAADRDLVARQYANGFQEVFQVGVPILLEGVSRLGNLEKAIILTQLTLLAQFPDSLIARKRGLEEAELARHLAAAVLSAGWPHTAAARAAFAEFDAWLTALGNARNPGTSADLVTASIFAALRDEAISRTGLPFEPG